MKKVWRKSEKLPTPEEFVQLRQLAGMSPRDVEGVKAGLPNSNYIVAYRDEGKLIGMGRVIGDGATTFQLVDICVDPTYQRQGIGVAIMTELVTYLETHAAPNAYVSLIADGPAKHLYEQFGFQETMPASLGMHRRF